MRTDPQRPKQQSAECSREIPRGCIFIYHKLEIRAFLFAILLIIRKILTLNHQTVVIMNIEAFINETVKGHNRSHPEIIIAKSYHAGWTWYFLYQGDTNIWGIEDVILYEFLWDKLSQERIYPCLQLREIVGKQKIGIAFEVKG